MNRRFLLICLCSCLWSITQAQGNQPALPVNGTVGGVINPAGTINMHPVTTTAKGKLTITLNDQSNAAYVNVYLMDNNGATQLNGATATQNSSTTIVTDGLAAGTYFVKVTGYAAGDTATYSLTSSFTPAPGADIEPNNSRSQAQLLAQNSSITGNFGYYYNQARDSSDWFKVTTTANGLLRLTLTDLPTSANDYANCDLYDNDGVTLLNSGTATTGGTLTINTDGLAAGTYYVRITQYSNTDYAPYILTDSLLPLTNGQDAEPDNDRSHALSLPLNGSVNGNYGYYYNHVRDTSDWYKVTTTGNGLLSLSVTDLPTTYNAYVVCHLYDNDGVTLLNQGTATTGGALTINTDGLAAGTYYVQITQQSNGDYAPYTLSDNLTVPAQPADAEPNNSPAQALVLPQDGTVTGNYGYYYNHVRDTSDWYRITTSGNGLLKLTLTDYTTTYNAYINIRLFDGSGTQLNAGTATTGGPLTISTDGLSAGTYYVQLTQYSNGDFAPYSLSSNLSSAPVSGEIEPNNSRAQAQTLPINSAITGNFGYYYDQVRDSSDWFKITTSTDGMLKLNITDYPSSVNDYVNCRIYDNDGVTQLNAGTATTGGVLTINADGLAAGTYYVEITQYSNNDYASYTLTDTLVTYNAGDAEPDNNPYQAKLIAANTTATGHLNFYYNGARDNTDWWKINYTDTSGNYTMQVNILPHLSDGAVDYINLSMYGDTTASPVYANTFTNASNSFSLTGLAKGAYWIKLSYYSPNDFLAYSLSPAFNADINRSQTIRLTPIPDTTYKPGLILVLHDSASSGLPVHYTLAGGPATLVHDTLYVTAAGSVTLTVTQPGDSAFSSAVAVQQVINILKESQKIHWVKIPPHKLYGDAPFALDATSSSGLPVSYSIVSGPGTIGNDSVVTITGVGTLVINAGQGGNGNINAAPDTAVTLCIGAIQPTAILGDSLVCPASFIYSVTSVPGAVYEWSLSGGGLLTDTGAIAHVLWQTTGIYTLQAKAYSTCDSIRSTAARLVITVTPPVVPDPIQNMLPANGTTGLSLPLSLSWIPGANTSLYDLYLWDADSTQPSLPYAANLTSVNFTITGGLIYNRHYKWLVISRNTCSQRLSAVSTFSLVPLPDLRVSAVQAPATAFSGQPVAISWKVSNDGAGSTSLNQSWTDAVFLSFDSVPAFNIPPNTNPGGWSQLNFPVVPLLIAAVPNVSALDSGKSYSNSLTFTLPANYDWPLYAYVITNYSPGANAPLEISKNNDTAHAPNPVIVTLSPSPDLRVDSVVVPNSAFSGNTIQIGYTVKNYGVTTPPADSNGWVDNVYLSKDPFFDVNTAILLTQPNAGGTYTNNATASFSSPRGELQKDSSYSRSVAVTIPNFVVGTYYIYVATDAGNQVYEGTLENNNTRSALIQLFITPTPVLTVSSLALPVSSVSTTQSIGVNWTIKNNGYYDNLQNNQGFYLQRVSHCPLCYIPYCNPGLAGSGVNCINCNGVTSGPAAPGSALVPSGCPLPEPGYTVADSLGHGSSTWSDYVYLSKDSGSLDLTRATLLGTYLHAANSYLDNTVNQYVFNSSQPRLYVYNDAATGQLTGTSAIVFAGTNVQYGAGIPDGANPRAYDVNTSMAINPGAIFPGSLTFNIPDSLPQGNYYIYVYADADSSVYEYPAQRQTMRSTPIAVHRPDLIVPSVTVPSTGVSGQSVNISYTVQNNGPGSVTHNRHDYVYISAFPAFDGNARQIANLTFADALPAGAQVSHSLAYSLPAGIAGTSYFYVVTNADSSFRENNQANNLSTITAALSVTLAQSPLLSVSSVSMPDTVFSVLGFPFRYTVPNQGPGVTTGSWTDSIYVSCSPVWNPSLAYAVGARPHSNTLPSGSSYTDSFSLQIPLTFMINPCLAQSGGVGYFYVKTNADRGQYEGTPPATAVLGTGPKLVRDPLVDQIVNSLTAADSAIVGRNYSATWSVENIGYNPGTNVYSSWTDALYFSPDSSFDDKAIPAGSYGENNPLGAGQSYTSTNTRFITPNIPAGNYYLLLRTNANNSIAAERQLTNNTGLLRNAAGQPVFVYVTAPALPDLTDSLGSLAATVATGQPLLIRYQVTNQGPGTTYPSAWSDDCWLSTDYIAGNAGDIHLGSVNHAGALRPGQSYSDSLSVPIGMNVPPGNYILIVATNSNSAIFETNTTNNLSFRSITVYSPAPADLTVANILHPDTVWLGYPAATTWNLVNNSPNTASGVETDGIYLSQNTSLDSNAVLVGTIGNTLNLLPLSSDTQHLSPLLQNVPEGSYYMLVKTDILDNIVESNKDNNTGLSAKRLFVKVKQLPLNIRTAASLGSNSLFYKLIVPDSLLGATLLVTLTSNDSLTVNNQFYIGGGYIPSAAHFDYAFGSPNAGNQQILLSSVTDSVYYITALCTSLDPPVQSVSLLAVNLPFAILNVNASQGGNTGNVTVKISGSLFATGMKAVLHNGSSNTDIIASAIYYINSTTVYATFGLLGEPLGTYDVRLTKKDSSGAVLAGSFSVVAPDNGGLITGSGVNTGETGTGTTPGCDPGASSGLNAQLQTQLVIPSNVFAGWPFTIQINYSNPTNVDIPVQTRILYSNNGLPLALTPDSLSAGNTSLYLPFTELDGPPNIIRAGASGTITVYSLAPANYPGHTKVYFKLE